MPHCAARRGTYRVARSRLASRATVRSPRPLNVDQEGSPTAAQPVAPGCWTEARERGDSASGCGNRKHRRGVGVCARNGRTRGGRTGNCWGLVLVNVAVLILVLGRRRSGRRSRKGGDDGRPARSLRRARAAFPFGVFSMAMNVTTLALIAVAAKEISGPTPRSRPRRSSSCARRPGTTPAWCP